MNARTRSRAFAFTVGAGGLLVLACSVPLRAPVAEGAPLATGTAPRSHPTVAPSVDRSPDLRPFEEPRSPSQCGNDEPNVVRTAAAVVGEAGIRGQRTGGTAWDHKTKPLYQDAVVERFGLTREEQAVLAKNGFVVPDRLDRGTYALAFHDIFTYELPVYVSIDSLAHAVFKTHEEWLPSLEYSLRPILRTLLEDAHRYVVANPAKYGKETARDADLYLSVARALLDDTAAKPVLAAPKEAQALVEHANAARGIETLDLFGRQRVIDWSQYALRGHYALTQSAYPDLAPYFRASMWLSRLEINLVSRSNRAASPAMDSRETPREVALALALGDAIVSSKHGADLRKLERAWTLIAGRREDVSLMDLEAMRANAKVESLLDVDANARAIKAEIGAGYARTVNFGYQYGSGAQPVVATLLGPRIVADATLGQQLIDPWVPDRFRLRGVDLAYALGNDRAQAYASHLSASDRARAERALSSSRTGNDLYGAWLEIVRSMARGSSAVGEVRPSFMRTEAFSDSALASTLVAYGQLRHNHTLYAAQVYDFDGCEIPDGYVQPDLGAIDAMIAFADRGSAIVRELDSPASDRPVDRADDPFAPLAKGLRVLRVIAERELRGEPLTDTMKAYLSMIVEYVRGGAYTGDHAKLNGWYLHMFPQSLDAASFVADISTSTRLGTIDYVGATDPRVGFFVVDTGGPPRLMVGPVARGYEHTGPLARRLDDAAANAMRHPVASFSRSYMTSVRNPDFHYKRTKDGELGLASSSYTGSASLELVGEHGATASARTVVFTPGKVEGGIDYVPMRVRLPDGSVWPLDLKELRNL